MDVKNVKIILIALFTCTLLAAQTRDDLKQKYGDPVSETFVVRPGILVTATYGPMGRIIELLFAPETTDLIKSRTQPGISRERLTPLLDELVPKGIRGKHLISAFLNMTCLPENDCWGSSESYENVTIYYNVAPELKVHYAVVRWK
jgi:hypothetical protein